MHCDVISMIFAHYWKLNFSRKSQIMNFCKRSYQLILRLLISTLRSQNVGVKFRCINTINTYKKIYEMDMKRTANAPEWKQAETQKGRPNLPGIHFQGRFAASFREGYLIQKYRFPHIKLLYRFFMGFFITAPMAIAQPRYRRYQHSL